jgi:hypothetical protein
VSDGADWLVVKTNQPTYTPIFKPASSPLYRLQFCDTVLNAIPLARAAEAVSNGMRWG